MSIRTAMKAKFSSDAYALVFEVPNATGFAKSRSCDAMAVSLWPSRGLDVHGFEFKASRSDWLRELKEPAKAEAFHQYCDFWWLVTEDSKVCDPKELPKGWGLMTLTKNGDALRTVTQAERLTPKPWDRAFVAAFARGTTKENMKASEQEMRDAIWKEVQKREKQWEETNGTLLKKFQEKYEKLEETVREFERETGIIVGGYNYSRSPDRRALATAMRVLNLGIHDDVSHSLRSLMQQLSHLLQESGKIHEAVDAFKAFVTEKTKVDKAEGVHPCEPS